jgi:sulfur carrier protein
MRIFVNGNAMELPEGSTLAALLETLRLGSRRLAVEVNLEIVPRSTYAEHRLRDGDRVEVVQAIGGG